jgi:hypothetical protein
MSEPQSFPVKRSAERRTALGITSFVLGLLSVACALLFLTGIPAIITGHIARRRAKREPEVFGAAGFALAGLILGYFSVFATIAIAVGAALMIPQMAEGKSDDPCSSNLRQIGLAARIWSIDHNEVFPPDFRSMSNELGMTSVLICPSDKKKTEAANFEQFDPAKNVSYEYLVPNAREPDVMEKVAFRCPIHGNVALGDGTVQNKSGQRRR